MPEPRSDFLNDLQARRAAVLNSGRVSPAARAAILGCPIAWPTRNRTPMIVALPAHEPPPVVAAKTEPALQVPVARRIVEAVAAAFEVAPDGVFSRRRSWDLTRPRYAAYRLLQARNLSTTRIGMLLKRDHTTVVHGLRRALELHDRDLDWRRRYEIAKAALR